MFNRSKPKPHRIDTLIGAGTRIIGDVQFAGGFHVDGHVKGNVDAPADSGAIDAEPASLKSDQPA